MGNWSQLGKTNVEFEFCPNSNSPTTQGKKPTSNSNLYSDSNSVTTSSLNLFHFEFAIFGTHQRGMSLGHLEINFLFIILGYFTVFFLNKWPIRKCHKSHLGLGYTYIHTCVCVYIYRYIFFVLGFREL